MVLQDTARIPLYGKGGATVAYAVVDAVDAPALLHWRWRLDPTTGYAYRGTSTYLGGGRSRYHRVSLHRTILGLGQDDPREGDHIDRDRLNCCRSNLRPLPKGKGNQNRSGARGSSSRYRGVTLVRKTGKWQASVGISSPEGRKAIHLGTYSSEEEAGAAARAGRLRYLEYATD